MNSKTFLVPSLAVMTLLLVGLASAAFVSPITTTFNDVQLTAGTTVMAGSVGETVPIRVVFTALGDAQDVRVKVSADGFANDVSASTDRFDLVNGSTYSKLLSLTLPSSTDNLTKSFLLHVTVANSDSESETDYMVSLQRDSYSLSVVSVDYDTQVSAGDSVPVSVVIDNNGMRRSANDFVVVSIPSLGVSAKGYLGDLISVDDDYNNGIQDSSQKTVYLKIPSDAKTGVYNLVTQVYNADTTTTVTKTIAVGQSSASTSVIAGIQSQDIKVGETKTYDLIIVNSNKDVKVYNLQAVSVNGLVVSVPTVVTVNPESSITVPVSVTAQNALQGTYSFTVNVNDQPVAFTANVTSGSVTTSVVALTVVLVIIFVVLLVVLIVLLSRKEKPTEEVETSYY